MVSCFVLRCLCCVPVFVVLYMFVLLWCVGLCCCVALFVVRCVVCLGVVVLLCVFVVCVLCYVMLCVVSFSYDGGCVVLVCLIVRLFRFVLRWFITFRCCFGYG